MLSSNITTTMLAPSHCTNNNRLNAPYSDMNGLAEYSYPVNKFTHHASLNSNPTKMCGQSTEDTSNEKEESDASHNLHHLPGDEQKAFAKLSECYEHLQTKIFDAHLIAKQNGKELLILVGESHNSVVHDDLQHMILQIASQLGINKYYIEMVGEEALLHQLDSTCTRERCRMSDDLRAAQKYGFELIPIDVPPFSAGLNFEQYDIWLAASPDGMRFRNKYMIENLKKYAKSGVCTVGADHLIGIASPLEDHASNINDSNYEVLEIPLYGGDKYLESIAFGKHRQALDYYARQDRTLIEAVNLLKELDKDKLQSVFNRFINQKDREADFEQSEPINYHEQYQNAMAFKEAMHMKELETIKVLLTNKHVGIDDIMVDGLNTPLTLAIRLPSYSLIKEILALGADPGVKDVTGWLPLELFHEIKYKVYDCLKVTGRIKPSISVEEFAANVALLLERRVANKASSSPTQAQKAHSKLSPKQHNFIPFKNYIDKKYNQRNDCFDQPLHIATRKNEIDQMKALLDEGADVNARGDNKDTPLHIAVRNNNIEAVKVLLATWVVDIDMINARHETALDIATSNPSNKIIELLLAEGADPTKQIDLPKEETSTIRQAAGIGLSALFLLSHATHQSSITKRPRRQRP